MVNGNNLVSLALALMVIAIVCALVGATTLGWGFVAVSLLSVAVGLMVGGSSSSSTNSSKSSNQSKPLKPNHRRSQGSSKLRTHGRQSTIAQAKRTGEQEYTYKCPKQYESDLSHSGQRREEIHSESKHFPNKLPLLDRASIGTTHIQLESPYVVYKATRRYICELILLPGTKIVIPSKNLIGNGELGKIRANEAFVSGFYEEDPLSPNSLREVDIGADRSIFNRDFHYYRGQKITPNKFNESAGERCTNGIHFWATPAEALKWAQRSR